MAEGDAALREEMEKVRERTRLQALVQGAPAAEAEARAAAAVEAFCAKWGIRPDVVGVAPRPPLTPLPRPMVQRGATAAPLPAGESAGAAAAALAERRRRILDEFDRTCIEVTAMIEDRIAECRGLAAVPAPGTGIAAGDLALIARDLRSLRGGLRSMLALCEELLTHLDARVPPPDARVPPGGEPPAGGAR